MSFKHSQLASAVSKALAISLLVVPLQAHAMTSEEADLNDDGVVNFLDFYQILQLRGVQRGEAAYREALDINGDGIIDTSDYLALFPNFGQTAETTGTTFSGKVVDENNIPIQGVKVQLGTNTVDACTDQFGNYSMDVPPEDLGENELTFFGGGGPLTGGGTCVVQDATPGTLSGQYPTIPHKPVFVNGGTDNVFRLMSLPERDLTGSVDITPEIATDLGDNTFQINEDVEVNNAGVGIGLPQNCVIQFPSGEPSELSISRVDPAMLPVPPPPNLASSLFVTFQPGGTNIEGCDSLSVIFDNVDGYQNADDPNAPSDPSFPDIDGQPFLTGVSDGAFQEVARVIVGDLLPDGSFVPTLPGVTGSKLQADVPVPFEFAWYGVVIPLQPCPPTDVVGRVLLDNVPMDPVVDALVTLPGIGPVLTDATGSFLAPNVPAGPNGPFCFINPFNLSATASKDLDGNGVLNFTEIGASMTVPAVPGGITDVGDIKLGQSGTVRGSVMKLNSIDPFLPIPLPEPTMELFFNAQFPPLQSQIGSAAGDYQFNDVPVGGFNSVRIDATFDGVLPLPGGGSAPKFFFGQQFGQIAFEGQVINRDFKFLGHGEILVTVTDELDQPLPGAFVDLFAFGGNFNGFSAGSEFCFLQTDDNGQALFNQANCGDTIPMGGCELFIFDDRFGGGEIPLPGQEIFINEEDGCFINEHGQLLELGAQLTPPELFGDILNVNFGQAGLVVPPDTIDVIEVKVEFDQPFDSFFDIFFELHIDMDQDPTTGFNSDFLFGLTRKGNSVNRNFIAENVGAEARIVCNDDLIFGEFGLIGQCGAFDENGVPIPGLEPGSIGMPFSFNDPGDPANPDNGKMVLLIPKQPLIDFANTIDNEDPPGSDGLGAGPWDLVLETGVPSDFGDGDYGFYGGLIIFDMVPNVIFDGDSPIEFDPNGTVNADDPFGDIFFSDCYYCGFD